MNTYIAFFLGTPRRLVVTIMFLVAVWICFNLDKVVHFLNALLCIAINQVLPLMIFAALMILAFKKITGIGPKKKGK